MNYIYVDRTCLPKCTANVSGRQFSLQFRFRPNIFDCKHCWKVEIQSHMTKIHFSKVWLVNC